MSGTFEYKDLSVPQAIRLMELLPDLRFKAPIRCSLHEINLSNDEKSRSSYEALSYVWGSPTFDRPIQCDGKTLLITVNLEAGLRRLRKGRASRLVWVDAICINQNSVQERNHQVELMGKVYAQSSRVIVWLGEPGYHAATIWYTTFCIQLQLRNDPYRCIDRTSGRRKLRMIGPFGEKLIDHVENAPWFSRIWTIQEFVFAPNVAVLLGSVTMKWDLFDSAWTSYAIVGRHSSDMDVSMASRTVPGRIHLQVMLQQAGDTHSQPDQKHHEWRGIHDRLLDLRQHLATDPKDKVYGVFSILRRIGIEIPELDYSKTVAEIYEDFTVAVIKETASLRFSILSLPSDDNKHGLPSWVPDLSISGGYQYEVAQLEAARDCYASESTKYTFATNVSKGMISLCGLSLGIITASGTTMPERPTNLEVLDIIKDWEAKIDTVNPKDTETALIAFERMVFGRKYEGKARYTMSRWDKLLQDAPTKSKDETQDEARIREAKDWLQDIASDDVYARGVFKKNSRRFMGHLENRRFFVLDSGHVGTAYRTICTGDTVVLAEGAELPVVLRPRHGGCWQFICAAYVYNVMYGSVWSTSSGTLVKFNVT